MVEKRVQYTGPTNAELRAQREAERAYRAWETARDSEDASDAEENAAWEYYVKCCEACAAWVAHRSG